MNIWKYKLFEEMSRADLYHAIKPEYAVDALKNNRLPCHSIQRSWEGGIRLKDDHPDYNSSDYLRGISLTRDIKYAKNWQIVVFIFDQEKLKTKWKIIPYNWGYSIGRGYRQGMNAKREREEFLITGLTKGPLDGQEFLNAVETPEGNIEPLNRYLKGFIIEPDYMKDEYYKFLSEHPLYMGTYERDRKKFKLGKKK